MRRFFFMVALVTGLLHSVSQGQDKKVVDLKKEVNPETEPPATKNKPGGGTNPLAAESTPGEVEIYFLNGSKVRVVIQTEKLEIASIYGKLTVPIEDVQAIEFGLHFPVGAVEKIDGAIKNLGSVDFRARATAAKTLFDLGPYAYPAVMRATKGKESEVAARAKDIVQKLQAKYPKKDLRTNTDDRVVTATQTLVGRILTSTVKTKGEYFGEFEHKLAHMRMLRAVGSSAPEVDLTVDAATYANAGQWLETGYQLDGKSTVLVTAKGLVDQWPQQPGRYMCGPGGNFQGGGFPGGQMIMPGGKVQIKAGLNNQIYGGLLIGRIGEDGEPFIIGDRHEIKAETVGKLYLQIGPSPWNCATTGSYEVKISRKGD